MTMPRKKSILHLMHHSGSDKVFSSITIPLIRDLFSCSETHLSDCGWRNLLNIEPLRSPWPKSMQRIVNVSNVKERRQFILNEIHVKE
ncbi:hypothetical protein BaRGS_00004293 [Batillaria attramentaria]|uniref:Uncharacterized protein n=1 Tax=Batillaria attramentaria TaxID=370345 RepID=A0ABD0LYC3_9CAEN